jgi:hypothetical protein
MVVRAAVQPSLGVAAAIAALAPSCFRRARGRAMIPRFCDGRFAMTEIVTRLRPKTRSLFSWLLPAFYAVGCLLGANWPGHGGQLFALGAIVGVWASFLLVGGSDPWVWLLPTLVAGAPLMWWLGRLLDRLRVDWLVWAIFGTLVTTAAGYLLFDGHAEFEVAVRYHGSFAAFALCALQLGSYGATILSLAIGAGRGASR